jgi:FtsZ-interacting cell division protein YlmF
MEELREVERRGIFSRLFGPRRIEEYDEFGEEGPDFLKTRSHSPAKSYHITVRRQVVSFADAITTADGLKKGEQQILNLCGCDAQVREKIKDFLAGVNYAQEGTWEELGEHVYLLAPSTAFVETAPPTPRMAAQQN